jgi:hypothetical protein
MSEEANYTVSDKRHHQVEEPPMEAMEAPKAQEAAPTIEPNSISLDDLAFGLVIGHDKVKNDLVFDVIGNPSLAEILGMGVLIQDRVENIKDHYTVSEARRRDQQFMALSQALGKLMMEIVGLKQQLQGK